METREPATGTARDRLLVRAAHLDEQIGHWTGVQEAHRAAGRIDAVDWDQVRPGDLLEYRSRWEVVRRVNRTTVTVVVDPGWQDKILKRGVTAHRPAPAPPGSEGPPARLGRAPTTGRTNRSRPATNARTAQRPLLPPAGSAPTHGAGP